MNRRENFRSSSKKLTFLLFFCAGPEMRWCHGSFSSLPFEAFFRELVFSLDFHFHSFAIITPSSVSLNLFFMLILITTLNFMLKFVGSRHLVNWRSVKQFFGE